MTTMIQGKKIKLKGIDFIIPSLTPIQVKRLRPTIDKKLSGSDSDAKFEALLIVAHAALSRNYPNIKIEEVAELIDMGNVNVVMMAIMGRAWLESMSENSKVIIS